MTFTALCFLVFLLGLRHGVDADHLAAIDGLTRINTIRGRRFARYCGALFSAGHGVIVLCIAVAVGTYLSGWTPPRWFDTLGAGISIVFLLMISAFNFANLLTAPRGQVWRPAGMRSRVLSRALSAEHPLAVAAVGALFALSFDTMSQAALFGAASMQFGGAHLSMLLGLLFILGMMASDGANGLWISHLLHRADARAATASRIVGAWVATASLAVGLLGAARLWNQGAEDLLDGRELVVGITVLVSTMIVYVIAMLFAARRDMPPEDSAA